MKTITELLETFSFNQAGNSIERFSQFDTTQFEKLLREKDEDFWNEAGEKQALRLFHAMAERVPAYKKFLAKNKIKPENIKTIADFKKVPTTNKQNYTSAYSLKDRSWDGKLNNQVMAVSSGTTGEANYWPRGSYQDFEASVIHELLYKYNGEIDKYNTLLVICFPMGIYVSGVGTYLPSHLVATKHPNLSIASPGNFKPEVLRAVKHLQKDFEQIIMFGHPFLVKDVIETGKEEGIDWSQTKLKMMFCSEGFNEDWREYLIEETGASHDLATTTSTYGSSEMLLMGHETPLSILLRRALSQDKEKRRGLNRGIAVPNIFQYNPLMRYIEEIDGGLIFTSASGIPLVRYDLHDGGHIVKFEDGLTTLDERLPDWKKTLTNKSIWQLPFVMLNGRNDQTIIFYGANIYPEHIRVTLDNKEFFKKITGRSVMIKKYKKNFDEYFEVHIELRKGVKPAKDWRKNIQRLIYNKLREINLEYLDVCNHFPNKNLQPRVKLWSYQHPKYFKIGLKHHWIKKA